MKFSINNQLPYSQGGQLVHMDGLPYGIGYKSYAKTDPFTYTAKTFIAALDKKSSKGSLDDLVDIKLNIAKARTDLILAQIGQIREQKDYIIKGITYDQLKVQNLIWSLKPQIYKDYRKLFEFYRRKLDLYREARIEETRFLRNTMRLSTELRESLLEIKMETEKRALLSDLEETNVNLFDNCGGGLNY